MYIILILVAVIISSILSFISAGVMSILLPDTKSISIGYYFIAYLSMTYGWFRYKFKTIYLLKIFILRNVIKLNRIFNNIDHKLRSNEFYTDKIQLSALQENSIKTWNNLLKDKTTILNSGFITNTRTIQRGGLLLVLRVVPESSLTIIDSDESSIYCEVYIPNSYRNEMTKHFDKEQEKRMNALENKSRSHVESMISIS